jgi:predicted transcriptional regulator
MNKELEYLINEIQENFLNEDYIDLKENLEIALRIVSAITE